MASCILGLSALLSSPAALAGGMYPSSGWYSYESNSSSVVLTSHLPTIHPVLSVTSGNTGGYHGWVLNGIGSPTVTPILRSKSARIIVLPPKTINLNGPNAGGPLVAIPGAPAPDAQLGAQFAAMINQQRIAAGLPALQEDPTLMNLATLKAQDMVVNHYFDHYSVRYGYPYDMMHRAGIAYKDAGENLAGTATVPIAVTDLMGSPEHRANILDPYYSKTGWAVIRGGDYGLIIVQEFVG